MRTLRGAAIRGRGDGQPDPGNGTPSGAVSKEAAHRIQEVPRGPGLGPVSFEAWVLSMLKNVILSRTAFGAYVSKVLSSCRDRSTLPVSTALFPIPLPLDDVWRVGPLKLGVARRRRRAMKRLVHLIIMALNYVHSRSPFGDFKMIWRRPGAMHQKVYDRIGLLCRAGGPPDHVDVLGCGRKSHQLSARFQELWSALQRLGLNKASAYHTGAEGESVPMQNEIDELRPYRDLDASRLKLTGKGAWDPVPYLSDLFYMPYVEPRINQCDITPPQSVVPSFEGISKEETLKLCKVWDNNSLLKLFPVEMAPDQKFKYTKVFNNYKGPLQDRQIGDRRGANFVEGRIAGESKYLPGGPCLLQLMPKKGLHYVVGSLTDRRDFYHQFLTTPERTSTNVVLPHLRLDELIGTQAYDVFLTLYAKKKKRMREIEGDFLHGKRRTVLYEDSSEVVCGFASLFQGDHLGVEIATQSHGRFLCDHGLLNSRCRLQGGVAIEDDLCVNGLIIDDFFSLAMVTSPDDAASSQSVKDLEAAKAAYLSAGLVGSDDKDVRGSLLFKVCGMEIDSRPEVVKKGMVSAASPASKRFGLAHLTSLVCRLAYTDDALHSSLIGSWVSIATMRRSLMAIMNSCFRVIPADRLQPDQPMLWALDRKAADELAILSVLAPIAVSNLAAEMDPVIYATDASMTKGGITSTLVGDGLAKHLWRTSDQKSSNVPLLRHSEALLSIYDPAFEETDNFEEKLAEEEVKRPLGLNFGFIEVCGGAGVVSKHLGALGAVVGPILDLSFSSQYDLTNHRVLLWLIHMLESGRLRSLLCSPPCTSFSPAAYPCVRSYSCAEGFDQTNPKVSLGNILAYYCLVLLFVGLRVLAFVMAENPRRSKMRWLKVWKALLGLGASETFLASCMYGSPFQKEFCFMSVNMRAGELARKCSRDHPHVRIEGKLTKGSAVYCEGLAKALAWCFWKHLRSRREAESKYELRGEGLEDVVTNDLCAAFPWDTVSSWKWRKEKHINILETEASNALAKRVARRGGDMRYVNLLDSHVARSAVTKARTSSYALRGALLQRAAICLAYGLYPAHRFSPTRYNPADHPTRDKEVPHPVPNSIIGLVDPCLLFGLFKLRSLRRWIANWARLALLAHPGLAFYLYHAGLCRRHGLLAISSHELLQSFDATLGYPGEGPLPVWIFVLPFCSVCGSTPVGRFSHGDAARRASREGLELKQGRRVLETTSSIRQKLFDAYVGWLVDAGKDFDEIFMAKTPDLDLINEELCAFGRWLFHQGKPYYHFSELMNSITSRRPILRRSLQQAWDLAFMWGSFEPVEHHIAMPHQVLVALIASAWCWGWSREAAIFALSFGALLRIGEVLQSRRGDVLMPEDVDFTVSYVLIRIKEPKTRFRAARHQASKVEQPDLISIIRLGFSGLRYDEPLWHLSGATLRARFVKLLEKLKLPSKAYQVPKPLTLASFRPGGATWLIAECEDVELVKRRGRWASYRVMECYLQEVMASTYLIDVPEEAKKMILQAVKIFPRLMVQVMKFKSSNIPEATWWFLLAKGHEST